MGIVRTEKHLKLQYISIVLELNIFQKKFQSSLEITNIYRIQACDSIMCGYFCIGFIDFMLKGKSLLDYTNLYFTNDYERKYK